MNNTPLTPEAEAVALSNVPVLELGAAFAKSSPEGQALFRERLGPILENLTKAIAMYGEAESIYKEIMFPVITINADAETVAA